MAIKAILFDLDGTLLPMDQDVFVKTYFTKLSTKMAPHGYQPHSFIEAIWEGTRAMVKNNGTKRNDEVFWDRVSSILGDDIRENEPYFDAFYQVDFQSIQSVCGFNPLAADTVNKAKQQGLRVALATNPLFPAIATESRIKWAGLAPEDFEFCTTYENISYCKPNPDYYLEITKRLGVSPEECLMVGNDVDDDMVAENLGMKVFLLTDCLINKKDTDISRYPNGDFVALSHYISSLL